MELHSYPLHIGDLAAATQGLSLTERGAYRSLLDQYYAHEKPLPLDHRELYRMAIAITPVERKAVDYVLKFFDKREDGYHQKRCDYEIEAYRARTQSARESAQARWNNRNAKAYANASPTAQISHDERNANQNHKPHTPIAPMPGFDRFWSAWPASKRKINRKGCLSVWERGGLEPLADAIVAHVQAIKETQQWRIGYDPAPLTYLNQRRWEDGLPGELEPARRKIAL